MIVLVLHGYAHRVWNSKTLESATVSRIDGYAPRGAEFKIGNDWKQRSPQEMNLTGAELDTIRTELMRYTNIFPKVEYVLPSNEPPTSESLANHAAMQDEN